MVAITLPFQMPGMDDISWGLPYVSALKYFTGII